MFQYQDLYNIPQTAFEDALKEKEVESESEVEDEKEMEIEGEDDGPEFVAADSDEESDVVSRCFLVYLFFSYTFCCY